jgi:hypothetical protein
MVHSYFKASPKRARFDSLDTQPPSSDSEVSNSEFDICVVLCCMCGEMDTFDSLDGAFENGWFGAEGTYCLEHAEFGILYEDGNWNITREEFAQVCAVVNEIVDRVVRGI